MRVPLPPMGWNSWNTFGENLCDQVVRDTARIMKEKGYLDAGYRYIVMDDCWSLRERDENGLLVPDPQRFPHGLKDLSDYVHSLGFGFGMYSCAGTRTCANYPSSYDHEFSDAKQFAGWGVDYLKYDFCNFPANAQGRQRYATMSLALKTCGRDILFSACNWGKGDSWKWMKSIGAHMYRSTGDIFDNYVSFTDIVKMQLNKFDMSGADCFNDIDMLTVGMYGNGNVAIGKPCTDAEYRTQFALWCMFSAPLMIGGDVRNMNDFCEKLLLNRDLIRINQDPECRPPYIPALDSQIWGKDENGHDTNVWQQQPERGICLFKHLSDHEYALAYFNFSEKEREVNCNLVDLGLPYYCGLGLDLTDVFTGEHLGVKRDYYSPLVEPHDCKVYLCRIV